ncbi:hypothetical protein TL16_g11529 [Triparma laevis f. inornata]|uniref:Thioesterase domain-containing protein n=1 Tax=Triparma laevis f. inornata TaxID=1714386 RepID=A0A9W7ETR5_9STRA|nr:hypothetical protein TL16_g11529 [Triparma laevis f. inornata]
MLNAALSQLLQPIFRTFDTILLILALLINLPIILFTLIRNPKLPSNFLLLFNTLQPLPLGSKIFTYLISLVAPYSGSLNATCLTLTSKSCTVECKETSYLKNPFNSMHACALTNLCELVTGLAMLSYFQSHPKRVRGIVTRISTKYKKKARGKITAYSMLWEEVEEDCVRVAKAVLKDEIGEVVAEGEIEWNIKVEERGGKKKN